MPDIYPNEAKMYDVILVPLAVLARQHLIMLMGQKAKKQRIIIASKGILSTKVSCKDSPFLSLQVLLAF
jgi:hypothetical protein